MRIAKLPRVMGTNHTNASDAGAASRAGTTASPGIAADEWSRGESNPRPEPEQTFTAAQVLSLLRAKEAETVARLSRGYTRLAAAVIGAGERLGCTADDPMEVAAWLEKAAAAKAVEAHPVCVTSPQPECCDHAKFVELLLAARMLYPGWTAAGSDFGSPCHRFLLAREALAHIAVFPEVKS